MNLEISKVASEFGTLSIRSTYKNFISTLEANNLIMKFRSVIFTTVPPKNQYQNINLKDVQGYTENYKTLLRETTVLHKWRYTEGAKNICTHFQKGQWFKIVILNIN